MNLAADTLEHLFWGYTVIWICLFLYIFVIRIDQKRFNRSLDSLDQEIRSLRDVIKGEKIRAQG